METKAKMEEKVIKGKFITVTITPENAQRIVEVLNSIVKKAKPDRYEEFIVRDLIQALESPEIPEEPIQIHTPFVGSRIPDDAPPKPEDFPEEKLKDVRIDHPDKVPSADKVRMVSEIKSRTDKENQNINDWIKGSIKYAQEQMGIKTVPKSNSIESFWDWLYDNHIIGLDGNPIPK